MAKNSKQSQSTLEVKQLDVVAIEDIINSVITLKEAAEILSVGESTLRTRVIKGTFQEWEYRKSGGILLFCKKAIDARKNSFRIK